MGVRKINRRYFRLRLALLLEQILDQRFGVRAVPRTDADRLGDKPPVAIDQIGKRQAKRAVALRYVAMRIEQPLKCDAQLIEEMQDRRFISLKFTATTTSPRSLNWRCSASIMGISSRHGPHHVAQKFRKTTLPRNSFKLVFRAPRSTSVKSGAAVL